MKQRLLIPFCFMAFFVSWQFSLFAADEGNGTYVFSESTLKKWTLSKNSTWKISHIEMIGPVLDLQKPGKVPQKPVRRPAAFAIPPTPPLTAGQIDLSFRSTNAKEKGADICIFFGIQDETHFYYAHISNDSDGKVHNVIMRVDGTSRQPIHHEVKPQPTLTGGWQHARVILDGSGGIAVYVDDMSVPSMTASDSTYLSGKIGFGSFNDSAQFKSFTIGQYSQ